MMQCPGMKPAHLVVTLDLSSRLAFKVPETQFLSVSIWADVKTYSIGKLLDAASAAWRRQMRLHVSVESNGAESPA
jgi:hypothetical protein